jgi:CheY-like chemotaxis protein/anti-sigma regulatory factor (Ser/Thr protein kinase)
MRRTDGAGPETTVVVVDDEGDLRAVVRRALEVHGAFTVVGEAATGDAAIRLAATEQPDAVVLDLRLPDLKGSDVLASIRAAAPSTSIVIFSGSNLAHGALNTRAEGYAVKGVDLEVLHQAIQTETQSAETATFELGTDDRAVGESRRLLTEQCRRWRCDDLAEDAAVVVSELVSNAIRHAESSSELRMRYASEVLRIELLDSSRTVPQLRDAHANDSGGRGLLLVAALSHAWGVDPHADGKVVWVQFSAAQRDAS